MQCFFRRTVLFLEGAGSFTWCYWFLYVFLFGDLSCFSLSIANLVLKS